MKVIIAGGRDFNDYDTLQSYCDSMLANQQTVEVVSGTAKGADILGERYGLTLTASDKAIEILNTPIVELYYGNE